MKKEEKIEVEMGGLDLFQHQILKDISNLGNLTAANIKKYKLVHEEVRMKLNMPSKIFFKGEKIQNVKLLIENGTEHTIKKMRVSLDFRYTIESKHVYRKHEEVLHIPFELEAKGKREEEITIDIPNERNIPISLISFFSKIDVFLSFSFSFGSILFRPAKISSPIFLFSFCPPSTGNSLCLNRSVPNNLENRRSRSKSLTNKHLSSIQHPSNNDDLNISKDIVIIDIHDDILSNKNNENKTNEKEGKEGKEGKNEMIIFGNKNENSSSFSSSFSPRFNTHLTAHSTPGYLNSTSHNSVSISNSPNLEQNFSKDFFKNHHHDSPENSLSGKFRDKSEIINIIESSPGLGNKDLEKLEEQLHFVSNKHSRIPKTITWNTTDDYCVVCTTKFSLFKLKHHCRICGEVICHDCNVTAYVQEFEDDFHVCTKCEREVLGIQK